MIIEKLRRGAVAFGSLVAAVTLCVAATPQPALADGTRTITGTTSCTSGIVPFNPVLNVGSGWSGADSSYQLPGTQKKVWTKVIPSSATSVALDMFCYYSWGEYNGQNFWPYGTWSGYTFTLTPGTSTVNSTWSCSRHPVNPGPWVRTCTLRALSYG